MRSNRITRRDFLKGTAAGMASLAISSLTLTSLGLTAYAEESGQKVLTFGWPYEPATLDPARTTEDAGYRTLRLAGEALLRNVSNEAEPGCAESYEVNDDNTEYTFHLREDSVFSDGTAITSADFEYSLLRLLDPEGAYEQASAAYIIKNAEAYYNGECEVSELGIEVPDDYTLKLTLEYPTYPVTFTAWEFMPVNQTLAEELGISYGAEAENMLTNGPFTITDWVHDSQIILEKNENYWNADAISLDKIVLMLNATGDTAVDMLLAGELDIASVGTQLQADTLIDSGFEYMIVSTGLQELHINHAGATDETGEFLSNTNFRKALNYALDRDSLVAVAYTTDQAATRFISPSEAGVEGTFQEDYPFEGWSSAADTEKAQECLALALEELGKTEADIPTFTLLCYDSNSNMTALNAIMDMWSKALGITCTIDAQPIQNMISKVYSGDFDFWKGGTSTSSIDSLDLFEDYISGGDNLYNCNDETYDALYNTALYATSWEDRKDAMFELEQYFCDQIPDLIITWPSEYMVYGSHVTGLLSDKESIDVTYADIIE